MAISYVTEVMNKLDDIEKELTNLATAAAKGYKNQTFGGVEIPDLSASGGLFAASQVATKDQILASSVTEKGMAPLKLQQATNNITKQ